MSVIRYMSEKAFIITLICKPVLQIIIPDLVSNNKRKVCMCPFFRYALVFPQDKALYIFT